MSNSHFIPSIEPNSDYLKDEEKAFKQNGTNLLYPFTQSDTWQHLMGQGTIVKLAEEREATEKPNLQKLLDNWNLPDLIAEAQKILLRKLGSGDISALIDEMFEGQKKLPNPTDFRVGHYPKAEELINRWLDQGVKSSEIFTRFSRPKRDQDGNEILEKGKPVLEPAIKLNSITSRRDKRIYEKWNEGEKDEKSLSKKFHVSEEKVRKVIASKGA